jgi:hypothetical protein
MAASAAVMWMCIDWRSNKIMDAHSNKELIWQKIVLLAVFLFCIFPYFFPGLFPGSDQPYHLGRIESLKDALLSGIFPVKIHPMLVYGYGYGEGFFYSDFFIYLPAVIRLLGVSLEWSYKIYAILVFAALIGGMYYCVRRITGNSMAAVMSAVLYVLSTRVLGQMYSDFAIGGVTAAIFVPFCIAGMFLYLKKDEGLGMFAVGFLGVILTHAISTLLSFLICVCLIIVYHRQLFSSLKKFMKLAIITIFILMATSSYLIPMLEQFRVQTLKVSRPFTQESQNVISWVGYFNDRGLGLAIVMTIVFSVAMILVMFLRKSDRLKMQMSQFGVLVFTAVGLLFCWIPSVQSFWDFINRYGSLIQFPARLFEPATALILMAFGGIVTILRDKKRLIIPVFVALATVSIVTVIRCFYIPEIPEISYEKINPVVNYEVACVGSGAEWLPVEVDPDLMHAPTIAVAADGNILRGSKTNRNRYFTFEADAAQEYYDVPFIYYRGYTAVDEHGNRYKVDKNPENSLVRVYMSGSGTHTITVTYRQTRYAKMAYGISVVGWILLTCTFIRWRKHGNSSAAIRGEM